MRPVRLEMAGFASFREPTVVDFTGADYFALVGPTGAGKSTVIDAITFALYGSVPRWDNQRTVSLALAPTAGRGTVQLLFDVGGARYVAARELRRAASGGVTVRSARLERLRDPSGLGGVDSETDPLADGGPGVSAAVEELLGLPFGDFITCVVLPQGDFAEFLHTEPRKRQEKLVRILGLGVYDRIAREANTEATALRQRAEVLTEQLGSYADATADAEQAATERTAALTALAGRVAAVVPQIAAAAADLAAAEADASRIRDEGARLAALAVPDGVAGLDERRVAADAALTAGRERAGAAETVDSAARDALAAAPDRAVLATLRRDHAEHARLTAERPGITERHDKARAAYDSATRDADDARAALDAARQAHEAAAAAATAAADAVRRITGERDGLRALTVPAGLDVLDGRRAAAGAASSAATSASSGAEAADARARSALAAAPEREPLERARREFAELASARAEQEAAAGRLAAARRATTDAGTGVDRARHALEHAEAHRDAGRRADLAAALRPSLTSGDPCPVCAQAVTVLPAPLPATDLDGADAQVAAAARELDRARRAQADADAAAGVAGSQVARIEDVVARLRAGLDGHTPDAVEKSLAERDRAERAARDADTTARAARAARDAAARDVEAVRDDLAAAGSALRAARDPLVPFGAPAPTGDDVLAGWTALVGWAGAQADERDAALPGAHAAVTATDADRATAQAALDAADRAATDRRRDETAAARAEQEARGALAAARARLDELGTALDGGPSDADAARDLARVGELEAAAGAADTELRAARTALRSAERSAAEVGRDVAAAWDALRAARDPLVPHGAPGAAGDDLGAAWDALVGWARAEAGERRTRFAAAETSARAAREERDAAERRLAADLAAHDVSVAASGPAASGPAASGTAPSTVAVGSAPAAVAAARERALAAGERIAERRASAARLLADRDAAESAQQVAKMLGGLLRSDGFPRWLVASALDALVADASSSLAELSGGQFALTHDHGEFLVIDHADADARRPVKTLSGGETFQASLALALALSAQMSGLAARGAARLESIFLDEGFGTLDEANLETVAATLESLAARGDRMVGVVTHVPALAERVPVRFRVSRDQATSSVVREDL